MLKICQCEIFQLIEIDCILLFPMQQLKFEENSKKFNWSIILYGKKPNWLRDGKMMNT
jgi:hypothetical protein